MNRSGSDDYHCKFYNKYPVLALRYKCKISSIETCKICLQNQNINIPQIINRIDKHHENKLYLEKRI